MYIPAISDEVKSWVEVSKHNCFYDKELLGEAIENIIKALSLSKDDKFKDKVIQLLPKYRTIENGGAVSKWQITNAFTELAQNYTLEKRLEIEKYMGKYLVG